MWNHQEYKQKHEELLKLARSVDLYKNTPQTPSQSKKANALWEQLQADTFAHECSFLERKLQIFTDLLAVLKKEK